MENTIGSKYGDQIKFRKLKLEKMRKERHLWQFEREIQNKKMSQGTLEDKRLKYEIREKAKLLKDSDIDELNSELTKFQDSNITRTASNFKIKEADASTSTSCAKNLYLNFSQVQITEIFPKPIEKLSKQTQTEISRLNICNKALLKNSDFDDDNNDVDSLRVFCKFSSNLPPGILSPGLPNVMDIPPAITPIDKSTLYNRFMEGSNKMKINSLGPTKANLFNKTQTLNDFQHSLKRVGLIMEKAIVTNKNFSVDYIGGEHQVKDNDSSKLLNKSRIFCNHNWTKDRCVTSIDWSIQFSGQIVAAYYKNEKLFNDTDGDVIIWNQNIKENIPEHVFCCHSPVLTVSYAESNPNLILGSTYSGQIVMWDSRLKSPLPVQHSKLNPKAHSQPIYCLRSIDDNNIISISLDGKICAWNLDMISKPLDVIQLQFDVSHKLNKQISVTCMDFPKNGINNLVLGAEDGYAYLTFHYGFKSGVNKCYKEHKAPVTGISSHYNQSSTDFGDLFLTSSIDGTVKMWSLQSSTSICTFKNNYDYAMDVAWSPIHPALFIAVDGSGHLDIYNLNNSYEEPIKSFTLNGNKAINRVTWNNNGQQLSIGTENGELHIYNIEDVLANPSQNEWNNFKNVLNEIKSTYEIELINPNDSVLKV